MKTKDLKKADKKEKKKNVPMEKEEIDSTDEAKEIEENDDAYKKLEENWLRLRADFDNFRKRTLREKERWSQFALEGVMLDMLSVLDHFKLGLKNADEHEAKPAVVEGFQLVYDQFLQMLKKHSLQPIDALHTTFNPELHEAISYLPSDEVDVGSVIEQTRAGYKLGDKLIRAAQVVVSSGPVKTPTEEDHGDK